MRPVRARLIVLAVGLAIAAAAAAAFGSGRLGRPGAPGARPPVAGALPAPSFPEVRDLRMTLIDDEGNSRRPTQPQVVTFRRPDWYRFDSAFDPQAGAPVFVRIQRGDQLETYFPRMDGAVGRAVQPAGLYCGAGSVYRLGFLERLKTDFFILSRDALREETRYVLAPRSLEGIRFAGAARAELRLWLNRAGLPVRLESTDAAGKLFRKLRFTDVRLNQGLPDDAFEYRPPPDVRVVPQVGGIPGAAVVRLLSIEEARPRVRFRLFEPHKLPPGFSGPVEVRLPSPASPLVETDYVDPLGCRVALSQYPVSGGAGSGGEKVRLPDGTPATWSQFGAGISLAWTREATNLLLRGPVSLDELVVMAGSVR